MLKKSHGPAFRKPRIKLADCPACNGAGVVPGVFHELDCDNCNASGWIDAWTEQALPLPLLAAQLGRQLRAALQHIEKLKEPQAVGPEVQYQNNNRRGVGGSNYTGD